MKFQLSPKTKRILRDIVLPIFLVVYFIPGMVVRLTYIPSESMQSSLLVGDKVLLSRLHYVIRTPKTLLQLPFFEKKYIKSIRIPSLHIRGLARIKRGGVVVFNYPGDIEDNRDMRPWWVKRIIGLPNDRISIQEGNVLINGKAFYLPEKAKPQQRYLITLQGFRYQSKETKYLKQHLQIPEVYATGIEHTYVVFLPADKARALKQYKEVTQVKVYTLKAEPKKPKRYFSYGRRFADCLGGNEDNLPEVTVPAKGMTIKITQENLYIYGHVIEHHEGNRDVKIDPEKGTLHIQGKQVSTYTFRQDYYFVMGDNRPNSYDSRGWGFLPYNHVVGKPLMVLASNKNRFFLLDLITLQLRWNRFFKIIR